MSKSVPTILVLGAIGGGMLAVMMQHLTDVQMERRRSPYAVAAENALGPKRVGRVRIAREPLDEATAGAGASQHRLVVRTRVVPFAVDQATADRVGRAVWFGALRAGDAPRELQVVLTPDGDGESRTFTVARPIRGR